MKKHVKSTDPRKKFIVTALKALTGANKVTCVYELDNSVFQGDCLKGNRAGYEKLGTFTVSKEQAGV
jgi:hypothetical protein